MFTERGFARPAPVHVRPTVGSACASHVCTPAFTCTPVCTCTHVCAVGVMLHAGCNLAILTSRVPVTTTRRTSLHPPPESSCGGNQPREPCPHDQRRLRPRLRQRAPLDRVAQRHCRCLSHTGICSRRPHSRARRQRRRRRHRRQRCHRLRAALLLRHRRRPLRHSPRAAPLAPHSRLERFRLGPS